MTALWLVWFGSNALANPYANAAPIVGAEKQPFVWEVPSLAAGPELEVTLRIPAGYAVYRDYLAFRAADGPVSIGEPVFPEARLAVDPSNPEQYRALYDSDLVVKLPVKGSGVLKLTVEHQGCRKGLCWPITSEEHEVKVVAGE